MLNAFFLNALTFLVCAGIFAATVPRRRKPLRPNPEGTGHAGLVFLFRDSQLKPLAIVGIATNFVLLPFLGLLLPVMAIQKFQSVKLLGVSLSAFGLAATVGALSFARLTRIFSRSAVFYSGLIVTGASIILCALATNHFGVVGSATMAGLLLGAGNPLEQTVLQERTPRHLAGQVFTSLTAIRFLGGPVGLLLAGAAAEFVDVEVVLIAAGGLLVASAVVGWWRLPFRAASCVGT